jgi:hypothetical protein
MKRLCTLLLILCSLISITAMGTDFWLETQVTRSGGKSESQVLGIVSGNISGPIGYFVLGQAISDGYRQVYAGPSLKIGHVEIGVGIGRENMPDSTRRATYVLGDVRNVSFVFSYEDGGSGPWHTAKATYKVTDSIGIGVMDQSFFGFGPRVEYDIAKGIQVWSAVVRERHTGNVNGKLAINFSF